MGVKVCVSGEAETRFDGQSLSGRATTSSIGFASDKLLKIIDFEIALDALTLEVTLPEQGLLAQFIEEIKETDFQVEVAA